MFTVEEVSIKNEKQVNYIIQFLKKFNLEYENDIDYTIAVYDKDKLIGTASKHQNVLKCFAVNEDYQGLGIVNTLVKTIEDQMFKQGIYHFFIYTICCNKEKFQSLGYSEIISAHNITLLEHGIHQINSYLNNLKIKYNISQNPKACIIMNANPFTLGHRYLIERASRENDEVIVFVVSEDQSKFPFSVRFHLVSIGVKDLTNVKVIETGPYLISNATFPTYFLKQKTDVVELQTKLDCEIFLKYYKEIFNINVRYVGNEPYCEVTNTYNQVMSDLLPKNGICVKVINRIEVNKQIISASKVRENLENHNFEQLRLLVPDVTYNYLINNEWC
ncbi:MAG: citC [Haloplasmataceae bacterium]|nr:citC [Haloplasmataceae bacterium]